MTLGARDPYRAPSAQGMGRMRFCHNSTSAMPLAIAGASLLLTMSTASMLPQQAVLALRLLQHNSSLHADMPAYKASAAVLTQLHSAPPLRYLQCPQARHAPATAANHSGMLRCTPALISREALCPLGQLCVWPCTVTCKQRLAPN
jgi:hypothetical protein